jgi:simple sugar transport system permease protein
MSAPGRLPRWADIGLLPVASLLVALAASAAVVALAGENPWTALRLLGAGAFGSQEAVGYTLYYATDFIFTGLAVAVAYHAGLFNIGSEGQAYIGGLGVGLVCLGLDHRWPFWAILPLALVAAAGFGAAWAFIPAWLQARRGSHVVITTIMFNFIASSLMTYLLVEVLIKPGQQSPESREFAPAAWLPSLPDQLGRLGIQVSASPLNLAFVLAVAAAGLVWVFLWRTRWGYELRTVGQNPSAAVYAGISPSRVTMAAMLISGGLAGGLGLNEVMGVQHRLLLDFPGGAGFVGIAVAFMGRNHPVGIFLAAVLFGALYQGGSQLSFDMPRLDRDLVVVIQGLVILSCGALENLFRAPLAQMFHASLRRRDTVRSMNIATGPTSRTSGLMAKPPKT